MLEVFKDVRIEADVHDEALVIIDHDRHVTDVLTIIDAVRTKIREANAIGKVVFGPRRTELDDADEVISPSTLHLLTNLSGANAVVCDDRALNKEAFAQDSLGKRVRSLTTLDVIEELKQRSLISETERRSLRHRLRAGGAVLMPVDAGEISSAALRSKVMKSAEFKAIEESIDLARLAEVPIFPREVPWFASFNMAANAVILDVWKTEVDRQRAAEVSDMVLELVPNPEDWIGRWGENPPPGWIDAVRSISVARLPDKIDAAILRPGRLGKHIQIPLPDADARLGILQHHLGHDAIVANLADIAARLEGASGAVIEQIVRDARRNARSESRPLNIADLQRTLPPRIVQSDQAYHLSCVHEAGHIVVGHFLGAEAGRGFIEAKVFREAKKDGTGGWAIFHHIPSVSRGKAAYLAQITILLSGIAAEEVIFGERTGGGGGDDDSDLRHATVIATAMEMSLGLGDSLVYLSAARHSAIMLSLMASDPFLRKQVSGVLDTCLQQAKDLIAERSDLIGRVVQLLQNQGQVTASDVHRLINPEGGRT